MMESLLDLGRLTPADDRFVSDLDIRQFRSVVGADVATDARPKGAWEVVGASRDIGCHFFTVTSELNRAAENYGMPVQMEANETVFVPITTARRMNPERKIKETIAREAGPDADWLRRGMQDPTIEAYPDETGEPVRETGIRGTLSFVIGGQLIRGAVDSAHLKELVAEARAAGGDRGSGQRY